MPSPVIGIGERGGVADERPALARDLAQRARRRSRATGSCARSVSASSSASAGNERATSRRRRASSSRVGCAASGAQMPTPDVVGAREEPQVARRGRAGSGPSSRTRRSRTSRPPWSGARAASGPRTCGGRGCRRRPRPTTRSKRLRALGRPQPAVRVHRDHALGHVHGARARSRGAAASASRSAREAIATGRVRSRSTPLALSGLEDGSGRRGAPAAGRPRAPPAAGRAPWPVRPPPHGFSRGWEASKTVTEAPSRRELPREERARRARSHDRDLHAGSPASIARSSSSGLAVAVPSLPTTTPAARFASTAPSGSARARGQRQRERRDHGVAGAGDVEHLARGGRDVQRLAVALEQAHAVLAARDEHRAAVEPAQDLLARRAQVVLAADAHARGLLGLRLVGRHHRGARGRGRSGGPSDRPAAAGPGAPRAVRSAFMRRGGHDALLRSRTPRARGTTGSASRMRSSSASSTSRGTSSVRSRSARTTCWWCATMRVLTVVGRPLVGERERVVDPGLHQRAAAPCRPPRRGRPRRPAPPARPARARCSRRCRRRPGGSSGASPRPPARGPRARCGRRVPTGTRRA